MGQATQTLAKSEPRDMLHCTVAGQGERITLVSPIQRIGMEVGKKKELIHPHMPEPVLVDLPHYHSFVDINRSNPPAKDHHYLKPLHIQTRPGDCVYIPAFWWH